MARRVFVSYSRSDQHLMRQLVNQLESSGHDVWVDESGIEVGDTWAKEIVTAIRSSQVFVLLATSSSVRSADVRKEVALAGQYRIPIVPVLIPPVRIPDQIAYHISDRHQITAEADNALADFSRVATEIDNLRPARPPRPRWVAVAGLVAVLVFLGSTGWTLAAGTIPPWTGEPPCDSVSAEVVQVSPATFGSFDSGLVLDVRVTNDTTRTVHIPAQRQVTARGASGRQYSPSDSLADQSWFFGVDVQPGSNVQLELGLSSTTAASETVGIVIPDVNESRLPFLKCTIVLPPVRLTFAGS